MVPTLVVPRGGAFVAAVREAASVGVDALFDTALLGAAPFRRSAMAGRWPWCAAGMAALPERGIEIRQVWVRSALERTDWLGELRELASDGRISLRVAASIHPKGPLRHSD